MERPYFNYNGVMYYKGTVMLVRNYLGREEKVIFKHYNSDNNLYCYCGCIRYDETYMYEKQFYNSIISILEPKSFQELVDATWGNTNMSANDVVKSIDNGNKLKDTQIDGLTLAWMWYIFLMAISLIFNARLGLWILISVIFFSYRSNKIKKEGSYYEW